MVIFLDLRPDFCMAHHGARLESQILVGRQSEEPERSKLEVEATRCVHFLPFTFEIFLECSWSSI
jgi:hypothetical protein